MCSCFCPARPGPVCCQPPRPPAPPSPPSESGAAVLGASAGTGLQPALTPPTPILQSFGRIRKWLEHARSSPSLTILAGGQCDDSVGYFVEPCIIESKDPQDPIMKEVTAGAGWGWEEAAPPRASRGVVPSSAEDGAALPGACLTPGESSARPCAQAPRPQIPDAAGWADAIALTACCPQAPTASQLLRSVESYVGQGIGGDEVCCIVPVVQMRS